MCGTCGCADVDPSPPTLAHDHGGGAHTHANDHGHGTHTHAPSRTLEIEQNILAKNDLLAAHTRQWLAAERILALNLMSSPGSGKTTLLERTVRDLGPELDISVIEGDQETALDAERIRAAGRPVVQINTGSACHLDAEMVARGLRQLGPPSGSVVLIENVDNLVCLALLALRTSA